MENPWSKPSITQLVKRHKVWLYHIIVKVASLLIILKIKQTSELTMMVLGLRFDNRQGGLDAFFAAAGTRWTVAGLSRFLQEIIQTLCASSLAKKITMGGDAH